MTQRRRRRRNFSFYPVDQRFAKQLLGSRSAELLRVKQLVGSRHLAWLLNFTYLLYLTVNFYVSSNDFGIIEVEFDGNFLYGLYGVTVR